MRRAPGAFGRAFERALWGSRLTVLVGVVAGVLLALGSFWVAVVDVAHCLALFVDLADPSLGAGEYADLRGKAITTVVKALDGFLIGALLLLFAFGLYELFVGDISAAEGSEAAPRLLVVSSLDDLKEKVARLVLLVLVVEFFQRALNLEYERALDLLFFAGGVLLVSAALYLSGLNASRENSAPENTNGPDRQEGPPSP